MSTDHAFDEELARWGPDALASIGPGVRASRRYCRRLARRHYENFTVASALVARRFRQPLSNIYAYCRWADDLADETGDPARSLKLLEWWQQQLGDCYHRRAVHPVFVALGETIRQYDLSIEPFADLLVAFRQDQTTTRYATFDQLAGYCRYSANPVGQLVLGLGRTQDAECIAWSDSICTGLQLANFAQDVARDWDRGRIYIPQDECRRFSYNESEFDRREASDAFRQLLASQVDRAEEYLQRGWPLVQRVDPGLRLAVCLFIRGGLAILEAIRQQNFDVWTSRPVVKKRKKIALLTDSWWRLRRGRLTLDKK